MTNREAFEAWVVSGHRYGEHYVTDYAWRAWQARQPEIDAKDAEIAALKAVLVEARDALESCYQVADYPANGRSAQDYALASINAIIDGGKHDKN